MSIRRTLKRCMMRSSDYEPEEREYTNSYTVSSIDKLDWPDKVELQMWYCIRTRGRYLVYHWEVLSLEDCVKTNFYGLDFATPIEENIKKLDDMYHEVMVEWIVSQGDGVYYHPKAYADLTFQDRDRCKKYMYDWLWHRRFEFVRDLFASKRGLFYGKKAVIRGKQLSDS